jgi:phosphoribosylanthranilate isomerase
VASFLLTSETTVEGLVAHHGRTQTSALQLVDRLKDGADGLARLRQILPSNVHLVQVLHVPPDDPDAKALLAEARSVAPHVNAVLLDSGNNSKQVLGGTGRVHDWNLSRDIRDLLAEYHVPMYLAGGLRPENVEAAIEKVRPFGLDLCSGLRTNEKLDPIKLRNFMNAVHRASERYLH